MTSECNLPRDASGGIDYDALARLLPETHNLQDQADILHILFKDKSVSPLGVVALKMPSTHTNVFYGLCVCPCSRHCPLPPEGSSGTRSCVGEERLCGSCSWSFMSRPVPCVSGASSEWYLECYGRKWKSLTGLEADWLYLFIVLNEQYECLLPYNFMSNLMKLTGDERLYFLFAIHGQACSDLLSHQKHLTVGLPPEPREKTISALVRVPEHPQASHLPQQIPFSRHFHLTQTSQ